MTRAPAEPTTPRVGYVVSRFPKTTETFIVREMDAVTPLGWDVWPFAINRERNEIEQVGARRLVARLTAVSDLTLAGAAKAQWQLLRSRPGVWWAMWASAIGGNIRSPKFVIRAVMIAWGAPALARRADELGLDHVHAHWGTHSALLANLMSSIVDVPYSVTLHAHDLHVDQTMLERKLTDAAAVVTISEHNAEIIRRQFPGVASKTSVVHCGVDTNDVPTRRQIGVQTPRVVCVAGLRGFKGHRHLLGALDVLAERGVDVTCDLVGDGPLRAELQRAAGPNVTFHGAVEVGAALETVASSDVFVMPSVELEDGRRDGIPVALMEAMAIGVPVIATDVSGIPELVVDGHTGLLVPPADPVAIADAIEALLADPSLRERLVDAARQLVADEFDIAITGRQMAAIFTHAAAAHDQPDGRRESPSTASNVTAGNDEY